MRVLLSLILLLGMVGCDGGGTASGPGEDTAVPEDTVGPTGCTLEDLTGRAYRITVLESQQPTDALNPTFAVDIATYVNIIVFHIVEHNQEEGYLMMRAGPCSAAFVDPDAEPPVPTAFYYGLETTPFRVELDGCNFEITEPTVLDMMFKTLNKPYGWIGSWATARSRRTSPASRTGTWRVASSWTPRSTSAPRSRASAW